MVEMKLVLISAKEKHIESAVMLKTKREKE